MAEHTGVMIALAVPSPERYALDPTSAGVPEGAEVVPAQEMHLTLAFLGDSDEIGPERLRAVREACTALAATTMAPTALFPASAGIFPPHPDQVDEEPATVPFWLAPQPVDGINALREDLMVHLGSRGVGDLVSTRFPVFNPHVTLAYLPFGSTPLTELPTPVPVEFDRLVLAVGGVWEEFPLARASDRTTEPPPLTASAEYELRHLSGMAPGFSADLLRAVYLRQRPAVSPLASRADQALSAVRAYINETSRAGLAASALPEVDRSDLSVRAPRVAALVARARIDPDPTSRALALGRALALAAAAPGRDGAALTHHIRALVADGNSSIARSIRARKQLRDRLGRWIEMGGGVRFKVRPPGQPSSWFHGTVEAIDVPNGNVTVMLEDGRRVSVAADKIEQPKAILGFRPKQAGKPQPGTSGPATDSDSAAVSALESMYDVAKAKNPDATISGGNVVNIISDPGLKEAEAADPSGDDVTFSPERNPLKGTKLTLKRSDLEAVRSAVARISGESRPQNYDSLSPEGKAAADKAAVGKAYSTLAAKFNERGADEELKNAPTVSAAEMPEVADSVPDLTDSADDVTDAELREAAADSIKQLKEKVSGSSTLAKTRDRIAASMGTAIDRFESGQDDRTAFLENIDRIKHFADSVEPSWQPPNAAKNPDWEHFSAFAEDIDNVHQAGGGEDFIDGVKSAASEAASLAESASEKDDDNGVPMGWTDTLDAVNTSAQDILAGIAKGDYADEPTKLSDDIADLAGALTAAEELDEDAKAELLEEIDNIGSKLPQPQPADPADAGDGDEPPEAPKAPPSDEPEDAEPEMTEEDYGYEDTPIGNAWQARDDLIGAVADLLAPDEDGAGSDDDNVSSAFERLSSVVDAWETLPEDAESLAGYAAEAREAANGFMTAVNNDPYFDDQGDKVNAAAKAVTSFPKSVKAAAEAAPQDDQNEAPAPGGDQSKAESFLDLYSALAEIDAPPAVKNKIGAVANAIAKIGNDLETGKTDQADAGLKLATVVSEVDSLFADPDLDDLLNGTEAGDDLDVVRDDMDTLAKELGAAPVVQKGADDEGPVSVEDAIAANLGDLAFTTDAPPKSPNTKKSLKEWNAILDDPADVTPEQAQAALDKLVPQLQVDAPNKNKKLLTYEDNQEDIDAFAESGQAVVDAMKAPKADEPASDPEPPQTVDDGTGEQLFVPESFSETGKTRRQTMTPAQEKWLFNLEQLVSSDDGALFGKEYLKYAQSIDSLEDGWGHQRAIEDLRKAFAAGRITKSQDLFNEVESLADWFGGQAEMGNGPDGVDMEEIANDFYTLAEFIKDQVPAADEVFEPATGDVIEVPPVLPHGSYDANGLMAALEGLRNPDESDYVPEESGGGGTRVWFSNSRGGFMSGTDMGWWDNWGGKPITEELAEYAAKFQIGIDGWDAKAFIDYLEDVRTGIYDVYGGEEAHDQQVTNGLAYLEGLTDQFLNQLPDSPGEPKEDASELTDAEEKAFQEMIAGFSVPDTIEGLEDIEGLPSAPDTIEGIEDLPSTPAPEPDPIPAVGDFTDEGVANQLEYLTDAEGNDLEQKLLDAQQMRDDGEISNEELAVIVDAIKADYSHYGESNEVEWLSKYLDGYAEQLRATEDAGLPDMDPVPEGQPQDQAQIDAAVKLAGAFDAAVADAESGPDPDAGGPAYTPPQELVDAANSMRDVLAEELVFLESGQATNLQVANGVAEAYSKYEDEYFNSTGGEQGPPDSIVKALNEFLAANGAEPYGAAFAAADPWAEAPALIAEIQAKQLAAKAAELAASENPIVQEVGGLIGGDLAGTDLPGDPTLGEDTEALGEFMSWVAGGDGFEQGDKAELFDAAEKLDGVGDGPTAADVGEVFEKFSVDAWDALEATPGGKELLADADADDVAEALAEQFMSGTTDPAEAARNVIDNHFEADDEDEGFEGFEDPDEANPTGFANPQTAGDTTFDAAALAKFDLPEDVVEQLGDLDDLAGHALKSANQALYGYTGDYSDEINSFLRDGQDGYAGTVVEQHALALAEMMDSSVTDKDLTVWRIIEDSSANAWMQKYMEAEVGEQIVDKGFLSTTKNAPDEAEAMVEPVATWDGQERVRVTMRLQLPAGTRALDVNGLLAGYFSTTEAPVPTENELLVDRETQLEITEREASENGRAIMLTVRPIQAAGQQEEEDQDAGAEGAPLAPDAAPGADGGGGAPEGDATPAEDPPGDAGDPAAPVGDAPGPAAGQLGELKDLSKPVHDVSKWTKNGSAYQDADGNFYYVKIPDSPKHAHNEVLHSLLLRDFGVNASVVELGDRNGDLVVVSKWVPGNEGGKDSGLAADKIAAGDEEWIKKTYDGFALDAWMANWDAVGPNQDNIVVGTDEAGNEVPFRIDGGGALLFSGFGDPKGDKFGPVVGELDTMRDPEMSAGKLFAGMTPYDVAASAAKLASLSPDRLWDLIASTGFPNQTKADLFLTLSARQADILSQTGNATPSSPAAPAVEAFAKAADVKKTKIAEASPNAEAAEATAAFELGSEPQKLWVGADGVQLQLGDKVTSAKDGLSGTVVSLSANGKYAKVLPAGSENQPKPKYLFRFPHTLVQQGGATPAPVPAAPATPEPAAPGNLKFKGETFELGDKVMLTGKFLTPGDSNVTKTVEGTLSREGTTWYVEFDTPVYGAKRRYLGSDVEMTKADGQLVEAAPQPAEVPSDDELLADSEAVEPAEVPSSAPVDVAEAIATAPAELKNITANNAVPGMVNAKGQVLVSKHPVTDDTGKPMWTAQLRDPDGKYSFITWKKYSGIGKWGTPSSQAPEVTEPAAPKAGSFWDAEQAAVDEEVALQAWEQELLDMAAPAAPEPEPEGPIATLGPKYAPLPTGAFPLMQMANKAGTDKGPVLVQLSDGLLLIFTANGETSTPFAKLASYQANPNWVSYVPGPGASATAPQAPAAPAASPAPAVSGKLTDFTLSQPLNPAEQDAVNKYGFAIGYKTVNPFLNSNEQVFDSSIMSLRPATPAEKTMAEEMIDGLDGAFSKAVPTDKEISVVRYSGAEQFSAEPMQGGEIFENLSYVSTALPGSKKHGYGYESKKVVWDIVLPKGTKALRGNAHENEILLPRGSKFSVESDVTDANGMRRLKVRLVTADQPAEPEAPAAPQPVEQGDPTEVGLNPAYEGANMSGPSYLGANGDLLYPGTLVTSTTLGLSGTVTGFTTDGKYAKVYVPSLGKTRLWYPSKLKLDPNAGQPGGSVAPPPGAPNGIPTPASTAGPMVVQAEGDPDSPLFGAPKPEAPQPPASQTGNFVDPSWLEKADANYKTNMKAFNPNWAEKPLSASYTYNKYTSVIAGNETALADLLEKNWITQELHDDAKSQMDANKLDTVQALDAYQQSLDLHAEAVAEWSKANGVTTLVLQGPSGYKAMNEFDAVKAMADNQMPTGLTSAQREAVRKQKSSSAWQEILRKNLKQASLDPANVNQQVKNFDAAVLAVPPVKESFVAVRTFNLNSFIDKGTGQPISSSSLVPGIEGTVQHDWGFPEMSPGALSEGATPGLDMGPVWMDLMVPAGTRGVWTGGDTNGKGYIGSANMIGERGFIAERGLAYYIHKVEWRTDLPKGFGGRWYVQAEILPKNADYGNLSYYESFFNPADSPQVTIAPNGLVEGGVAPTNGPIDGPAGGVPAAPNGLVEGGTGPAAPGAPVPPGPFGDGIQF